MPTSLKPFHVADPGEYADIREALDRAGYHEKGLTGLFGPIQLPTRAGRDLPHFLYLTRAARPLDTLSRLFVFGAPVENEAARQALAPMPLEDWARIGLVEKRDGETFGRVRLLPFSGLVLACDYVGSAECGGSLEQVMGITASSMALANFTVRRPFRATLDLGTGSGIQALLAAAHSQQTCGTDRSARSIEFARFNAALNYISNCEYLAGDTFEPVHGREFDLVVSNPPFAITPSLRYMYRDSGTELDSFCQKLVQQVPGFLAEDGIFQMCCDWAHVAGQDWKARLAGWFEGSGCDAWVLRAETHDAADYARVWIRDTEHETEEASAQLYDEWVSFYEAKGVEAVSTGLIAMRRASSRPNCLRIEDMPAETYGPIGDSVTLGFEMQDYLRTVRTDEAMLGERLRVSPLARLDATCEPTGEKWRPTSARIRLSSGIAYASSIDFRLAELVARSDGRHSVCDLLADVAASTGADLERIVPRCLSLLRELVERGFLLPDRTTGLKPPAAEE